VTGSDTLEDALEAGIQAERLQADRVWKQEPRSPRIVEHRVAAATRGHGGTGQRTNALMDRDAGRQRTPCRYRYFRERACGYRIPERT